MDNHSSNIEKNSKHNTSKLHKKINKSSDNLSDENIDHYKGRHGHLFKNMQEKYKISKEYIRKTLDRIEKECG